MNQTSPTSTGAQARTSVEKPKILLVDDLSANLVALEAVFSKSEIELVKAHSGKQALEAAASNDLAVILLDVQMPELDGYQTARRIRQIQRAKTVPIVFITANYPSEEHELQGYEAGAVDFLFKPVSPDVLRAKVTVFVDLFQKNLEIQRQGELLREIQSREQERELAEVRRISERKYQRLVEGIRDGIVWVADPATFSLSFISGHAAKLLGSEPEEWLSNPAYWVNHVHPEDLDKFLRAFQAAAAGQMAVALDHRFVRNDGKVLWFHTEAHLESELGRGTPEIHGLSFDITHLKETENALREAIRTRDEFLSIASHELKTPITPLQLQMQGFIRMIETDKISDVPIEQLKEMLEISDSQVSRMARLISQLLDISRIQSGRMKLEREEVNLSDLVAGVVDQFNYEIKSAECSVLLEIEPHVRGRWDAFRLEQVLVNLLTNALKYGAGRPIVIRLASDERIARFSVEDEGIGIAPKDQSRIFERFERAVSSKNFGGLGLGLFISKEIVELHGGTITVDSDLDAGAKFTVTLPKTV